MSAAIHAELEKEIRRLLDYPLLPEDYRDSAIRELSDKYGKPESLIKDSLVLMGYMNETTGVFNDFNTIIKYRILQILAAYKDNYLTFGEIEELLDRHYPDSYKVISSKERISHVLNTLVEENKVECGRIRWYGVDHYWLAPMPR